MKKWYLIAGIIALVFVSFGCSAKAIPPAAKSELHVISESDELKDFVEVIDVSDRDDYLYIMIYITSLPGEFTSLEDALPIARKYALTVAEDAVAIINSYDINKDVSVWAQLPLEDGGVTVLGHTEYDGKEYADFELYERD